VTGDQAAPADEQRERGHRLARVGAVGAVQRVVANLPGVDPAGGARAVDELLLGIELEEFQVLRRGCAEALQVLLPLAAELVHLHALAHDLERAVREDRGARRLGGRPARRERADAARPGSSASSIGSPADGVTVRRSSPYTTLNSSGSRRSRRRCPAR
jgi:hypothetical protein